jgi:hypothetical protein
MLKPDTPSGLKDQCLRMVAKQSQAPNSMTIIAMEKNNAEGLRQNLSGGQKLKINGRLKDNNNKTKYLDIVFILYCQLRVF